MRNFIVLTSLVVLAAGLGTGCTVTAGPPPPPAPVAEYYGEPPYAGAVWAPGGWVWHPEHRRYEWHHGDWRR